MDVIGRFTEVVGDEGTPVALDEASLLIAKAFHPDFDLGAGLWTLDDLAATCRTPSFGGLLEHLVTVEGFRGNHDDYHDPLNSMMNAVLTRRLGLPITLSVLAIEVGRRMGVGVVGIGMPGHFLVRSTDDPTAFADPYHGASVLDERACRIIFTAMAGEQGAPWHPSFLHPVSSRAIVIRMLNNLKALYAQRRDPARLRTTMLLRGAFPEVERIERPQIRRVMAPFN